MVQVAKYAFQIFDGAPENGTVVYRGTLKEGRAYIERIEDLFAEWSAQDDPLPMPAELAIWEGGDLVAVDENGRMLEWLDEFKAWTDHKDFKLYNEELELVGEWIADPKGSYYVYWGADVAPAPPHRAATRLRSERSGHAEQVRPAYGPTRSQGYSGARRYGPRLHRGTDLKPQK